MKLIRSDSPEVMRSITSAGVWASRNRYTLNFFYAANILALLITLTVNRIVSVQAGVGLGVPGFILLNAFLLWRGRSRRLNWMMAAHADRVYFRLFSRRARDRADLNIPDVLVLEASEIASMSIRTLELYIYGPYPRIVEWLAIEPNRTVTDQSIHQIRTLIKPDDADEHIYPEYEDGRLLVRWTMFRPGLLVFLKQVAQECPSINIAPEQRSELDLNGIWHGYREEPNTEQRRMLVQVIRLGFGRELPKLLWLHRNIPYGLTRTYLAEIEEDEAATSGMTEVCEREMAQEPRREQQLIGWIVALLMTLGYAYFSLRVAESLLAFSYASMGTRGVYVALAGVLMLVGFYAPPRWRRRRGEVAEAEPLLPGAGLVNDALLYIPLLFLLILAVAGSFYLGSSQLPLQTLPLQVILLESCAEGLLLPAMFLYQSARRKVETGSFLHSRGECACGKKSASPEQEISRVRKILLAAALLFNAVLLTTEVILLIYLRKSPLGNSRWVLADLYYFGIGWWFFAATSAWQAFHSSDSMSQARKDSVDESL